MRSHAAGRLVVLLVSGLLAVLLGCGDGGGGGPGPSPSPTPGQTPAATATPVPAELVVARGATSDLPPAVAWGGGRYLVAWSADAGRGAPDVVGVRLDASGNASDAAPLLLSDLGSMPFLDADSAEYQSPGIGFDGRAFGVFFVGSGSIAQFGAPGQVVGFTALPPDGSAILPATQLASRATVGMVASFLLPPIGAAGAGGSFVGVFQNALQGVQTPKLPSILSDVVTVDGSTVTALPPVTLLDARPPFQGVIPIGSAPGAAGNGAIALGAWIATLTDIATQQSQAILAGALLAPTTDPSLVTIGTARVGAAGVAVASGGGDFLVAWASPAADGGNLTEIRAIRHRAGSGRLDPDGGFLVADGPGVKSLGGVAAGAGGYLVVWADGGTVRGAHVATDGTAAAPFTIDDGPAASPAVASDGEHYLTVFVRPSGGDAGEVVGRFER